MESCDFLIMTSQQKLNTYWQICKTKKSNMQGFLANAESNHPNRVSQMSTSGTMSLILNRRAVTSSPFVGQVVSDLEYNIDFSLLPDYTRKFLAFDFSYLSDIFDLPIGQFILTHRPGIPWFCAFVSQNHDAVNVGTLKTSSYEWDGSAWVLDGEVTTNVNGTSFFYVEFGGYKTSDGSYPGGYAEGSDDYKSVLTLSVVAGLYSFTVIEKRYPWATWGSMSGDIAAQFADLLSVINASGDYAASGSISLAFNFS